MVFIDIVIESRPQLLYYVFVYSLRHHHELHVLTPYVQKRPSADVEYGTGNAGGQKKTLSYSTSVRLWQRGLFTIVNTCCRNWNIQQRTDFIVQNQRPSV